MHKEGNALELKNSRSESPFNEESLHSIEKDYIKVLRIQFFILMFIICGVVGFIAFKTRDESHFPILFMVLLIFFTTLIVLYPKKVYKYTKYGLLDKVFYTQKGLWFRKRTAVAQNRIQHTDVSQGPIERHYSLATLTMHTAGMKEADIQVSGLKHSDALEMRDHLIQLNKQSLLDSSTSKSARKNQSLIDMRPSDQSIATSVLSLHITEEE